MTFLKEIAQRIDEALAGDCKYDVGEALAEMLSPLIAEHDAKVRAEAIRSARDELGVYVGDEDSEWWDGYRNGQRRQNKALGEYADRIEKEAGL